MVFEKVRAIVAKTLNVEEDKITLETNLVEDLGADSLDAVDLIMSLEEEFGMEIDDDSAQQSKTIGDLVAYIEKRVK